MRIDTIVSAQMRSLPKTLVCNRSFIGVALLNFLFFVVSLKQVGEIRPDFFWTFFSFHTMEGRREDTDKTKLGVNDF